MGNKKVIVVGHPSCQMSLIEDVLLQFDVKMANPSRREGLSVTEINQLICHGCGIDITNLKYLNNFSFPNVQPIWQSLALDLELANLESPLWGWIDSDVLPLLDFWKNLDENYYFILVYNSPKSILKAISYNEDLNSLISNIENKLEEWCLYNTILLDFFLNNTGKCVLVHEDKIRNLDKCFNFLNNIEHLTENKISRFDNESALIEAEQPTYFQLKEYFIEEFLKDNLKIKNKYEELQSVANLSGGLYECLAYSIKDLYWISLYLENLEAENKNKYYKSLQDIKDQLQELRKEKNKFEGAALWRTNRIKELSDESNILLGENKKLKKENIELAKEKKKIESAAIWRSNRIKELSTENNILLETSKQIQQQSIELAKEKKQLESTAVWRKNHIIEIKKKYDLTSAKNTLLEQEKELLWLQLQNLQEEFEKYLSAIQNDIFSQNQISEISVSQQNQDVKIQKPKLKGAMARVKNELPYRLGQVMILHSHNLKGFIMMPLAVYHEISEFKTLEAQNMPPIEMYEDVLEAEKVKKHLSYRLGKIIEQNIYGETKKNLLKLPFELSREIVSFRLEKRKK
ncbi:hypothetical protein QTA56_15185 [Acinetobacter sp. VNH17]|uniref:Uncharacterized protein n=1 Tax=Acinetobacter thutiue TaxID=2998078 RepID=A0ABT7WSA4_9GAMM|nr:hypothetical protein [Acinetobacter thutiue]MCY6413456.1 hypothetical protein [Acinetobacter thutiue]MDN0015565.1 hypothetical protein [Acinetobacter thutiue]